MPQDWSESIWISDLSDEPQLTEELVTLAERATTAARGDCKHVVLNFAGVNYISSSHLAQMLRLRKRLGDHGRHLIVCAMTEQVHSVMLLTGLDRVFRYVPDPASALAILQMEGGE